jgi:hypothetical protein
MKREKNQENNLVVDLLTEVQMWLPRLQESILNVKISCLLEKAINLNPKWSDLRMQHFRGTVIPNQISATLQQRWKHGRWNIYISFWDKVLRCRPG